MKFLIKYSIHRFLFLIVFLQLSVIAIEQENANAQSVISHETAIKAARGVLNRVIGKRADEIKMQWLPSATGLDSFEIESHNGVLSVKGNSSVALCYGFNTYLKKYCHSMISWSGKEINIPAQWPLCKAFRGGTPYHYRYYLNVVTFGYTTAYWDWKRWEQEIDWMALHGINMALAVTSAETIAERVWLKLGLKKNEVQSFFTGPAHLPWHRMGNLNKWDGPLSEAWLQDQLKLEHHILNRMHELGIDPVTPAFAGFVPGGFQRLHPDVQVQKLKWGGFPKEDNAYVLSPGNEWFTKIGKLFIEEWEKEFGKNKFYLSDSFNEMDVPVSDNEPEKKYKLLADYGESIYKSISAGNPNATWVTQGWTFGYQHKFWDKSSVKALLSKVPDDKMLILDLANEYPQYVWHIDPVWKTHEGFYGKQWIYSYVPNFGGKTPYTGFLSHYASASVEALQSSYSKNLAGFGFAPEGIENNEIVYELLSDMAWSRHEIDLQTWGVEYFSARYGNCPFKMAIAGQKLLSSCYNSFSPYPRFVWQTVDFDKRRQGKVNDDQDFLWGVENFLDCSDKLKNNSLYRADAIELSAFYLGIKADIWYKQALHADSIGDIKSKNELCAKAVNLLKETDRLLASHPLDRLENWVEYARMHGTSKEEKDKYEANAKRLITTWGGRQSDYAARIWSGLISSYYIPRMQMRIGKKGWNREQWEEAWVKTPWKNNTVPYADPIAKAKELVAQFREQETENTGTEKKPVNNINNSGTEKKEAALSLIKRILPKHYSSFSVEFISKKNNKDCFELQSRNGKIVLRGTNGVAIAGALNYYLKNYLHCDISWNGTNLNIPSKLPAVLHLVHKETPYNYRYYLNYCTFNYSMSWWNWSRWEKEIDWMALNGINMPLALTGQNIIWDRVYKSLGFSDKDLSTFFSGPAYFNWFWMGNLDGWGGPLPQSWMQSHELLQKKILARERELGMTPVLPAFTGHVPPAFKDKFPDAKLKKTHWSGFPDVYILDPEDSLFLEIGKRFLKEESLAYGTDHLYSADTFNENIPPANDSLYLDDVSKKVYRAMAEVDPQAKWIMQGWLFHFSADFWHEKQIKALLNAVPDDKMIVLDLWTENYPVWQKTKAYYGKPWIWCMLHNFGGNISLYGRMDEVAREPAAALHNPDKGNMAGIGLTPEAIEQNPVMYELFLENVWRDTPIETDIWLKDYVRRRYGKINTNAEEAWNILHKTVYAGGISSGGPESIITGRPTFNKNAGCTRTEKNYQPKDLLPAWEKMIQASSGLKESDGFQYDLVDLTRQVLANYADTLQQSFAAAWNKKDIVSFNDISVRFMNIISDMDGLLATRKDFLLGTWLESAKKWGTNPQEKALYERNARDLITLWGDKNSNLHEYSCRQWSGLLKDFYLPRWEQFIRQAKQSLQTGSSFDLNRMEQGLKDWEWNWVNKNNIYPDQPTGNPIDMSVSLYHKYYAAMAVIYRLP